MEVRCFNCGHTDPTDPPLTCQRLYADGFLTFIDHDYQEIDEC